MLWLRGEGANEQLATTRGFWQHASKSLQVRVRARPGYVQCLAQLQRPKQGTCLPRVFCLFHERERLSAFCSLRHDIDARCLVAACCLSVLGRRAIAESECVRDERGSADVIARACS